MINKLEEQTEAGFCVDCAGNEENNTVLNSLIESQNFLNSLQNYLAKVTVSSKDKIEKQTVGKKSD